MPASIFNGAISFGLASVPITVLSAAEDHAARFRQIHTADHGLVRNHHWCEAEDREVTFAEIGRGCELPDGRVIPVTDEKLQALPLPTARAIELIAFVPAAAVDPLRIGPGYYLQPQGAVAAKPYLVLRHALEHASSYRGQPKAHLQHVLTAIAVNIERLSGLTPAEEPPSPRPPTTFQAFLDQHEIPRSKSGRTLGS